MRDLPNTRWPRLKGLIISQFVKQLEFLNRRYAFVTMQDCLAAIYSGAELPKDALLLTFDDGYIDHFISVFPILKRKKIQGSFFPCGRTILENKLLNINKLHIIFQSAKDVDDIIYNIYVLLDEYRSTYGLKSNEYYTSKCAKKDRFDSPKINFIKNLLHKELSQNVSELILKRLFAKFVTEDEDSLSSELYMNIKQIKIMVQQGMYIGGHGYGHRSLAGLSQEQQKEEVDATLDFLKRVGVSTDSWVMTYPFGDYNNTLIDILKARHCRAAFTVKRGVSYLTRDNAFTLKRFDANDFFPVKRIWMYK